MQSDASAILGVFREKNLKSGGFVHFTDFGEAIVWEDGAIRDESVREALRWLIAGGYLVEFNAGLRLTDLGEKALYHREAPAETDQQSGGGKYGARVYALKGGVLLVKQTVKRGAGQNDPYVVDGQRERHVNPGDDAALGRAVRDATQGRL